MAMKTDFCKYGLSGCGRLCCWLCESKSKCKHACTLPCDKYVKFQEEAKAEAAKLAGGRTVVIHYATKNHAPDPMWRDLPGVLLVRARGKGPKNVLVRTEEGTVVVPIGNVRYVQKCRSK